MTFRGPQSGVHPQSAVVVGLMSGTSLDGIAAAVVRFSDRDDKSVNAELVGFTSRAYTREEHERLARALV